MKLVKLSCPNCDASLEIKNKMGFCPYCGSKIYLDDGAVEVDLIQKRIDEAREKHRDGSHEIRLRELENEENQRKRERKKDREETILVIVIAIVLGVVTIAEGFFGLFPSPKEPSLDELIVPVKASEYQGSDVDYVAEQLESIGFQNIEKRPLNDLYLGILNKEGTVEKVSVNGVTDFKKGDIFPKKAKVVITYHSYKE